MSPLWRTLRMLRTDCGGAPTDQTFAPLAL
jgi:hypothetical protein